MARTYYYYKIIRKTIIQFLDLFNDIYVSRYDNDFVETNRILVPLKFGPKEKAYYWIKEYSTEEKLPIMSVNLASIDLDQTRMVNRNENIVVTNNETTKKIAKFMNPVPYTFTFTLNIWALHMIDIDQILEQILPYFNPNVMLRINIPELDATFENKVIFSNASPDMQDEWGEEDWRVLKWSLTFTVQSYLFKPLDETSIGYVEKFIGRVYTDDTSWADKDSTETTFTSGASGGYDVAVYLEATGRDEDAQVLYNYEVFE